ncbi:hypothetical protein PENTCL1PPCAC_8701, partial [Pristionchus entomophagus]
VNQGIAMCLNILALYLIFTKSRKEISQYRKLLVIFLVCGIVFAIMHLIIQPRRVFRENAFIFYATGWITDMRMGAAYCGVVSMSFLILAMHFIYRAMVLASKTHTNIQITNRIIGKIILILSIDLIVWTILCVVFISYRIEYEPTLVRLTADLDDYPEFDHEGRLMMFLGNVNGKLNLPPFIAILAMLCICEISFSIIIWSSITIIRVLNDD